jgi:hypothetical protein
MTSTNYLIVWNCDTLLENYFSSLQLSLLKLLNQISYERIMSSQIDETYNLTIWELALGSPKNLCHFNVVSCCVYNGIL